VQQPNGGISHNALVHLREFADFWRQKVIYIYLFYFHKNSTEMADSGKGKVLQNTGKFVSENRAEG